MVLAIQWAYYLEAQNPSDLDTLQQLAGKLALDIESFKADIASGDTEAELQKQLCFTRESGVSGFPSLALEEDGQLVAISVDYKNHETSLTRSERGENDFERRPGVSAVIGDAQAHRR